VPKTLHLLGISWSIPRIGDSLLKKPNALEIMLAHDTPHRTGWQGRHGVGQAQFTEREVKGILVALQIAIKEVRVFVIPKVKTQGLPTPFFVKHELTRVKRALRTVTNAGEAPNRPGWSKLAVGRPENSSRLLILRGVQKRFRVCDDDVVCVQQQDFTETTIPQGIGFELPAAQEAGRMPMSHSQGIHATHPQGTQPGCHSLVQFRRSQVPKFNRKSTARPAQHFYVDPGTRKTILSPAA
jgi:hypothetical protein